MDVPNPPEEPEVKNIIDKLANFVARNGAEFENMTKEKQKGNPKFGFLFGGEHYSYYQYRLNTERQFHNQQQAQDNIVQHSLQNAPWQQQPSQGQQQQGPQQPPIPPLMPPFPRFPPQMPMGGRMPMGNMPPWQQNQQMGPQRPRMNMQRFMPPSSGPNMRPGMRQPPPSQMYNQPPPGSNQGGPNMPMPQNQQRGPPPQNFNMYWQPPPNMPPQRGQGPTRPPFQYQEPPPRHQRPPQFNQPPDMGDGYPQNEQYPEQSQEEYQEDPTQESSQQEQEEDEEIARAEEDAETKIEESSNNLKQQYEVLMQQQQEKIENAIAQAQDRKLRDMASNTGVMTSDFDTVLQPIIASCTKDSISSGKSWILSNAKSLQHCEVISLHLLKRVLEAEKMAPGETVNGKTKFETQLHLVYLINDVLHHASRKNLEDLSDALQAVILPIFCTANANATQSEKERLTKLLGLWQKFKYFKADLLEKLKETATALSEYQANLIIEHASEVQKVQSEIQSQYIQYQKQHEQYAAHIENQVKEKKAALEKKREEERAKQEEEKSQESNIPPWANQGAMDEYDDGGMGYDYDQDPSMNRPPQVIDYSHSRDPTEWQEAEFGPRPPWNQGPRPRMGGPWQEGPLWAGGPPGPRGPGPRGPRPPMDPNDPSLIPTVPYYDLPAGLMCPLVKLEDNEYKPLDPDLIRLPPPIPPSERLLAAVEAFYGPPSHERPRNVDGWERNGLFEYYRAKVRSKRGKEGDASRSRSKSKSRSRSQSRSRSRSRRRSYSRSDSSRSRSRSRSRSKSRSRSRSQSKSPVRRSRSPEQVRRSRSRSRSNERTGRSPTPPLGGSLFMHHDKPDFKLGDENRGAQMLKRMGWGGAGLGANEQGRENPIDHAEVRDKYDQFKGLGMPTDDPYESFRKSKSQGFITRMKARDTNRDSRGTPRRKRNDDDR